MSAELSALAHGGVILGAAQGAAALLRGERITFGQKALIGAVLLGAPAMIRRRAAQYRRSSPPLTVSVPGPADGYPAAADLLDGLSDFALRPHGPHGHLAPARFRVVDGAIVPYTLRADGTWFTDRDDSGPVRYAGQDRPQD